MKMVSNDRSQAPVPLQCLLDRTYLDDSWFINYINEIDQKIKLMSIWNMILTVQLIAQYKMMNGMLYTQYFKEELQTRTLLRPVYKLIDRIFHS